VAPLSHLFASGIPLGRNPALESPPAAGHIPEGARCRGRDAASSSWWWRSLTCSQAGSRWGGIPRSNPRLRRGTSLKAPAVAVATPTGYPRARNAASSSWWRRSSSEISSSAGFRRDTIASIGLTMKKKTAAAIATKLITSVMKAP